MNILSNPVSRFVGIRRLVPVHIPRLEDYLPTPVVVLGALVVLALIGWLILFGRRRGRAGGLALLLLALAWIPLNKPMEGPILMRLGHDKGLVLADVLAVAGLLIAGGGLQLLANPNGQRRLN